MKSLLIAGLATLIAALPIAAKPKENKVITMYVQHTCTNWGHPDVDECFELTETERSKIVSYWRQYDVDIEFVQLKDHKQNFYNTPLNYGRHEERMSAYYHDVMKRNGMKGLKKCSVLAIMGDRTDENDLGVASFKLPVFIVDPLNHDEEYNDVSVTVNHEMGHAVFGWRHVDRLDNLMTSHSKYQTDELLTETQQKDIENYCK